MPLLDGYLNIQIACLLLNSKTPPPGSTERFNQEREGGHTMSYIGEAGCKLTITIQSSNHTF